MHFVKLGSQNIAPDEEKPYTGEISATLLKHFRVKYVIIGHSERRDMGETEALINRKIHYALAHDLEPVLCGGYGLSGHSSFTAVKTKIKIQLTSALRKVKVKSKLVIAYEPSGSISKGFGQAKPIDPAQAAQAIEYIKTLLPFGTVIYGASINSRNVRELAEHNIIEGGLVGGSSLDALEFLKIVKAFC